MKFGKLFLYVFLALIPFFSPIIANASTTSYLITTGISAKPIHRFGETFFSTQFDINYQTGRLYISLNPDGTGQTFVDDGISITVTRPDNSITNFFNRYADGVCGSINHFDPLDITSVFKPGVNHVKVDLVDQCGVSDSSSALYIVNLNAPNPTPTPTPTPTGLPAPSPFLDLPFDYKSKEQAFNDAATQISSFFDHTYPLLSAGISLIEPVTDRDTVTIFRGTKGNQFNYSSHDGYDYALQAGVHLGDPVLAAADGCAIYEKLPIQKGQSDGNNMIFIDHGNGYQTRYLHLIDDKYLITKSASPCVPVKAGQRIGSVGYSGAVIPNGPEGAHIHFMVVQDKNHDGNFDDNIPDGVTDPFGWQSDQPDPWPLYTFNYLSKERTGNTSFYLWKQKLDNLDTSLTSNGGVFNTSRFSVNIPENSTDQNAELKLNSLPVSGISNLINSIGSMLEVRAETDSNNIIHNLNKIVTITENLTGLDLSRFKTSTISFYSSEDGINWTKEPSTFDPESNTVTTNVNHFTYFAVMAERIDTVAPITTVNLSGDQGQTNWFRSDVNVNLTAQDNDGGLGVDYILYKLDDEDWQQYLNPVSVATEGHHTINFYSVDKDENIEAIKQTSFDIDKNIPEAKIFVDQTKSDLVVTGLDDNPTTIVKTDNNLTHPKDDASYIITDLAGNTLKLDVRDDDQINRDNFEIYSLQYNNNPPIKQNPNHLSINYNGPKTNLSVADEIFDIRGDIQIRIQYDSKRDQSTIFTNSNHEVKLKETRTGIVTLQLTTNLGELNYSY